MCSPCLWTPASHSSRNPTEMGREVVPGVFHLYPKMLKCQVFLLFRIPSEGFSSHHYDLRRNQCTDCQEPSTFHSPCCPSCSAALGASATLLLWLGCYKPGSCPQGLKYTGQFIPPGKQRLLQPFHRWMADTDYMNSKDILEKSVALQEQEQPALASQSSCKWWS